jgi:hypothetical protein
VAVETKDNPFNYEEGQDPDQNELNQSLGLVGCHLQRFGDEMQKSGSKQGAYRERHKVNAKPPYQLRFTQQNNPADQGKNAGSHGENQN